MTNRRPAVQVAFYRTTAARLHARWVESRRRVGTIAAFTVALLLAYHVVVGANGLNVYKQKLTEDKQLSMQVQQLQQENDRLKKHVEHLASDPDAIEYEAHLRLRYTMPGQVIVLKNDPPARATQPGK